MRSPSISNLMATFSLPREDAKLIKKLCAASCVTELREALTEAHCFAALADLNKRSVHTTNSRREVILSTVGEIVGGYGIVPLGPIDMHDGPPYEYVNMGDPYTTTLVWRRATDNLYIGCWATIAERHPNW